MNKDEMKTIEEMAMSIEFACTNNELDLKDRQEIAKTLYILGYRKVGEDEIVIKADIKCVDSTTAVNAIEFFAKHNAKVRQETEREILHKIKDYIENSVGGYLLIDRKGIRELANELGIELE